MTSFPQRSALKRPEIGRNAQRWLLLALATVFLALGGWVYVAARPGTFVHTLCNGCFRVTQRGYLPDFVKYCLPDGLWTLSSILMLHAMLRDEPVGRRIAFASVIPSIGIVSELMQGLGCLPGSFDIFDLACYSTPILFYIILQIHKHAINFHKPWIFQRKRFTSSAPRL